jgi:hypothetical protein
MQLAHWSTNWDMILSVLLHRKVAIDPPFHRTQIPAVIANLSRAV